jgi:hypothetical protein
MLEYDHHFRSYLKDRTCPTADLIAALAPEFPDQIVVGMDLARRSYWHGHFRVRRCCRGSRRLAKARRVPNRMPRAVRRSVGHGLCSPFS